MLCLAMFGLEVKAELPDSPPKKWPCDQVYNPKLDLKALWQGPDIKDNTRVLTSPFISCFLKKTSK